jgi:hypothetical protein
VLKYAFRTDIVDKLRIAYQFLRHPKPTPGATPFRNIA